MGIWRGLGGHTFNNLGTMPNSCTDLEQIWHTYAYSSENGHEPKLNPLIPGGLGDRGSSIHTSGKASKTTGPIRTKFDSRMQIRLHVNGYSWLKISPRDPDGSHIELCDNGH